MRWIPVAGDGVGNYYVLDNSGPSGLRPVYLVDHEVDYNTGDYVAASGLWHFLRFLLLDEMLHGRGQPSYWPFNRERVLAEDPDLSRHDGPVPLPWEK